MKSLVAKIRKILRFIWELPLTYNRIKYYLPIIYNDRDWDYSFLFKILRAKLWRMEQDAKGWYGTCRPAHQHRIKVCRMLCDRILKDNYRSYLQQKLAEEWGELNFVESSVIDGESGESITLYELRYEKELTEKDKGYVSKKILEMSKQEDYLRNQDISYLFKTMTKYRQYWWD